MKGGKVWVEGGRRMGRCIECFCFGFILGVANFQKGGQVLDSCISVMEQRCS